MGIVSEYKRQFRWRSWSSALDALPRLRDQVVLDLGCAVGDLTAELVARGARVIGVDMNEELLGEATSRRLAGAEFRMADLRDLPDLGIEVDGIWCSFTAAYIPDLSSVLEDWRARLRTGGWIALTEIDDLFGHQPIPTGVKSLLDGYARESLAEGRYDFHMGGKLPGYLERSGFTISKVLLLEDKEFSFAGPGDPEVVDAWRSRFDRMVLLRDFCGARFDGVRREFLSALTHTEHSSEAKVYCCIATK